MQFTEGRPRTLRVRSATGVANDVLVVVEDSGPGIDPENLDRIYHPFFTTKPQGTGMGLSISRSIIEAHNGRLTVSSAADNGSVFQIALPAATLSGNSSNVPTAAKDRARHQVSGRRASPNRRRAPVY
jgi:signal transduction histidine kinase